MGYVVLARKWRPLTFDDVVGQEHITQTLKKAIEKSRVGHAYIFTGTRGVGKTTTARILARALNCEKGPTPNPCGVCESCKGILGGSSFDVLEIDGASNNRVEDIRELRENVGYSSMGGKYRIYVIDEVHMLSKAAFNALLKTLEEPPKNVIFIFATTEVNRIPETILSRCQRYDFRPISPERIRSRLEHICTSEGITFDSKAIELVALKADGSMRDGLSLLDQVYSFCRENIDEKSVRSVLGLVESDIYNSVMTAINQKESALVLKTVGDILLDGYDLSEFLSGFQDYLRDALFTRLKNEAKGPTEHLSEADLIRMADLLKRAEADLRWSSHPRFLVEIALLKLVHMDTTVSLEDVMNALGAAPADARTSQAALSTVETVKKKDPIVLPEESARVITKLPSLKPPAPIIEEPVADFTEPSLDEEKSVPDASAVVGSFWRIFLDAVSQERSNISNFLSMARIDSSTPNSIDVLFPAHGSFQFSEVSKKDSRDYLEKKMAAFAGRSVSIAISLEKKSEEEVPADAPVAASARVSASLVDDMEKEPIIKTVLDIFKAEPV